MTDLDEQLAANPAAQETAVSTATVRPHRHRWVTARMDSMTIVETCRSCGALKDPERSRRGRSAARLGKDSERRIERVYGPRKVGEYGDSVDHIGRDFVWQSKATRQAPPVWLAAIDRPTWRDYTPVIIHESMAAMEPLRAARYPLVIQTFVRRDGPKGEQTRDRIWVRGGEWAVLHGGDIRARWLVMSGECFLDIHGRDEP